MVWLVMIVMMTRMAMTLTSFNLHFCWTMCSKRVTIPQRFLTMRDNLCGNLCALLLLEMLGSPFGTVLELGNLVLSTYILATIGDFYIIAPSQLMVAAGDQGFQDCRILFSILSNCHCQGIRYTVQQSLRHVICACSF